MKEPKKKIRLEDKAPAVHEQDLYITAGNLERAREYLKYLDREMDEAWEEYKKSREDSHLSSHGAALFRSTAAWTLFWILTDSEEASKRTYERATDRTV